MDQGFQKGCREGDGHRTYPVVFLLYSLMHLPVLSQDSTIDFEKRRNVPVRYDRELMQTTIHAMKRVAEVKKRREHAFWKNRYSIKL